MHPKVEEWLSEFNVEITRKNYQKFLEKFLEASNLTVEKMEKMTSDQIKHTLLKYRADLLKEGKPQNSVLSYINAIRSFCVTLGKPLRFRKGALGKVQADVDSHVFSNGDLRTLFEVGDTTEKAIISTACSLGWEISSFLELEKDKVKRQIDHAIQNGEEFIFFEDIRQKTGEARLAILNPLAIKWITKYFETSTNTSEKLFDYSKEGVNKILNVLAQKSGLKTTGNIRFHNIRKWLMSRLSRCNFNEFQIKYILGKAIPVTDRTYLQSLKSEIEEKYPRVYNDYLNIVPDLHTAKEIEAKFQSEFEATKLQLARTISDQEKKLEEAIKFIYSFEPVLNTFNEIANTTEGQALIKQLHEAKMKREAEQSQQEDDEFKAELTKEHPTPKRVKIK